MHPTHLLFFLRTFYILGAQGNFSATWANKWRSNLISDVKSCKLMIIIALCRLIKVWRRPAQAKKALTLLASNTTFTRVTCATPPSPERLLHDTTASKGGQVIQFIVDKRFQNSASATQYMQSSIFNLGQQPSICNSVC